MEKINQCLYLFLYFVVSTVTLVQGQSFQMEVIGTVEMLSNPWEVTYGPDGMLWITERQVGKVVQIDPLADSPSRIELLTIPDLNPADIGGQSGLLGMALHPDLGKGLGNDFVYLAYTYGELRQLKIARYRYDGNDLIEPFEILTGLPATTSHNSGRLIMGPDRKLYYTIGDQGANQYRYTCNETLSQYLPTQAEIDNKDYSLYPGKVLRVNLDGSIPSDNPVLQGVRSHIFTYGHRNAQGLVFSNTGKLYADEHGPKTDDEINLLVAGKNYGWPHVAGYKDDQAYAYCKYFTLPDCQNEDYDRLICPPGVDSDTESSWSHPDFMEPIQTMYTVPDNYDFSGGACGSSNICWPTIAPSSIDFYEGEMLPGWDNSLLVTSMKLGRVFRYKLSEDGTAIIGDPQELFNTQNRYRDIAISPDGKTFFIITDNSGSTIGLSGSVTDNLHHKGSILKFELAPPTLTVNLKTSRGRPISNAIGTFGEFVFTSDHVGQLRFSMGDFELGSNQQLVIEDQDYFTHTESIMITDSDQEVFITLAEELVNVTFVVSHSQGDLQAASVQLNEDNQLTDSQGRVFFLDQMARQEYDYQIELEGFETVLSSFYLERDTTISILMEEVPLSILREEKIEAYPNPSNGHFLLKGVEEPGEIAIMNTQGRIVGKVRIRKGDNRISVPALAAGMYFLKMENKKALAIIIRR